MKFSDETIKESLQKYLNNPTCHAYHDEIRKKLNELESLERKLKDSAIDEQPEVKQELDQWREASQKFVLMLEEPVNIEFVNRFNEVKFINDLYPPLYLLISAPIGYGKTRLMGEIERRFRKEKALCLHLKDLNQQTIGSLQDLTSEFLRQLDGSHLKKSTSPEGCGIILGERIREKLAQTAAEEPRVVFMIDEAEVIGEDIARIFLEKVVYRVQEILRYAYSASAPRVKFNLIISGRYIRKWELLSKVNFNPIDLTPFDFFAVEETVKQVAGDERDSVFKTDLAAQLMFITGGHPKCMADMLITERNQGFQTPPGIIEDRQDDYYYKNVREVLEKITREYIPEHLREIFSTLSVIRRLNPRFLKNLIEKKMIIWKGNELQLEDELLNAYLVKREKGFLKDDITRRLLAIQLRHKNPDRFIEICETAITLYREMLVEQRLSRRDLVAMELLFQELQFIYYQDRKPLKDTAQKLFFEKVSEILSLLIEKSYPEILDELIESLEKDWEFRFVMNYIFRKNEHYEVSPFSELMNKIKNFKDNCRADI